MAPTDPKARAVFWDVHSDLPREGPGNRESTARALGLASPIPPTAQVLDIACGPGTQTLDLAELMPDATICAVDRHEPFVVETNRRAAARGVANRVRATQADMRSLPKVREVLWICISGDGERSERPWERSPRGRSSVQWRRLARRRRFELLTSKIRRFTVPTK